MKYISLFLLLHVFSNVSCSYDAKKQKEHYPLVVDSFEMLINRYEFNKGISKPLEKFFGNEGLTMLQSCKVTNITEDTVVSESTATYNSIFYIDKYLQIDSNTYDFYSNKPFDAYPIACDTFLPFESKIYYLSHWRGPSIENGSKLYFQIRIRPGYAHCISEYSKSNSMKNLDSSLNVSVIYIDLESNQIHKVNSAIDSIYAKYKRKPNMINVSVIK